MSTTNITDISKDQQILTNSNKTTIHVSKYQPRNKYQHRQTFHQTMNKSTKINKYQYQKTVNNEEQIQTNV